SENISAGQSLAAPLQASGQFPADVVEMIAVGEQSNNLEKVLPHIAETLERDTWRRLDLFVRLLEPLMLLILAGIVLLVVVARLARAQKRSGGFKTKNKKKNKSPRAPPNCPFTERPKKPAPAEPRPALRSWKCCWCS